MAVAQVKSVRGKDAKEQRCVTSWSLRVSGPGLSSTSVEVQSREDKPDDNEWNYENSFELIGWSQDGSRLLAAAITAGGDWDETTAIVYDFQQRNSWRIELTPLFSKIVPRDCVVSFHPVRFAPTREAVISVEPLDDRNQRCFAKSLWALNYENRTVHKMAKEK